MSLLFVLVDALVDLSLARSCDSSYIAFNPHSLNVSSALVIPDVSLDLLERILVFAVNS